MKSLIHMKYLPLLGLFTFFTHAIAEDGYDLWLRYVPVNAPILADYRESVSAIAAFGDSRTIDA